MSKPINFYIITSTNTDKVYIGSTVKTLKQRLNGHIYEAKLNKGCTSKFIINAGDYSIDLLETVECNSEERFNLEMEYIKGYGELAVNNYNGRMSDKNYLRKVGRDYYHANKHKYKLKIKHYYEANKEKLNAYSSTKVKCECGTEVTKSNLVRHKKSKKHMEFIAL